MAHEYAKTMFTESVRRMQERFGSRAQYERLAGRGAPTNNELGFAETEFISQRDSFYMASVTSDGWPYVQHRGGPPGFLRALDAHTLVFPDYAGNKQYISAGNVQDDDRVSLFLMDYPRKTRLKVLGHASVIEVNDELRPQPALADPTYRAKVERLIKIGVVAFDWNCPQHITQRFTVQEFEQMKTTQALEAGRLSKFIENV